MLNDSSIPVERATTPVSKNSQMASEVGTDLECTCPRETSPTPGLLSRVLYALDMFFTLIRVPRSGQCPKCPNWAYLAVGRKLYWSMNWLLPAERRLQDQTSEASRLKMAKKGEWWAQCYFRSMHLFAIQKVSWAVFPWIRERVDWEVCAVAAILEVFVVVVVWNLYWALRKAVPSRAR